MVLPITPQKIVIVEDNISLADIYKTRLEMIGYRCFTAYDGEQALAVIQLERPNLVLLDLMVPKIAGDQILARMRASDWGKDIKVYIVSNLNESDAPVGLRAYGIEGYTVKANLSDDALDKLVDHILKPADQTESVSLETPSATAEQPSEPIMAPYNPLDSQPAIAMPPAVLPKTPPNSPAVPPIPPVNVPIVAPPVTPPGPPTIPPTSPLIPPAVPLAPPVSPTAASPVAGLPPQVKHYFESNS